MFCWILNALLHRCSKPLESDSHLPKKLCCLLYWKSFKMMKNALYFILKALFVLKIFKFLSWLFGHVKNGLIRKIRLISKFMTSQLGKQTIAIDILHNISRSKDYRAIKLGQLIEYNKRNIFLQKQKMRQRD